MNPFRLAIIMMLTFASWGECVTLYEFSYTGTGSAEYGTADLTILGTGMFSIDHVPSEPFTLADVVDFDLTFTASYGSTGGEAVYSTRAENILNTADGAIVQIQNLFESIEGVLITSIGSGGLPPETIRFSALSATEAITGVMDADVFQPQTTGNMSITPVPEPGVLAYLACATLLVVAFASVRRRARFKSSGILE